MVPDDLIGVPNCAYHSDVDSVGKCKNCERYVCGDCFEIYEGTELCTSCKTQLSHKLKDPIESKLWPVTDGKITEKESGKNIPIHLDTHQHGMRRNFIICLLLVFTVIAIPWPNQKIRFLEKLNNADVRSEEILEFATTSNHLILKKSHNRSHSNPYSPKATRSLTDYHSNFDATSTQYSHDKMFWLNQISGMDWTEADEIYEFSFGKSLWAYLYVKNGRVTYAIFHGSRARFHAFDGWHLEEKNIRTQTIRELKRTRTHFDVSTDWPLLVGLVSVFVFVVYQTRKTIWH